MTAAQTIAIYRILTKELKDEEMATQIVLEIEQVVKPKVEKRNDALGMTEEIKGTCLSVSKKLDWYRNWTIATIIIVWGLATVIIKFF